MIYPILLVVQNSVGKKRLVISLQYLNLYLWKCRFKYEDFRTVLECFEKDAFMFTFDLKSGYHHIDIHPDYQTYLGFAWEGKFNVHGSAIWFVNGLLHIY